MVRTSARFARFNGHGIVTCTAGGGQLGEGRNYKSLGMKFAALPNVISLAANYVSAHVVVNLFTSCLLGHCLSIEHP